MTRILRFLAILTVALALAAPAAAQPPGQPPTGQPATGTPTGQPAAGGEVRERNATFDVVIALAGVTLVLLVVCYPSRRY